MNESDRVDEDHGPTGTMDPVINRNENEEGAPAPEVRGARRAHPASRGQSSGRVSGLKMFFTRDLWSRELASMPTFRRIGYGVTRVAQLTITNFVKDRCPSRAAALTYITVLSLVPMLALGFSVAKGLGAYETLLTKTIVPFLDSTFGPADAQPVAKDVELAAAELSDAEDDAQGGDEVLAIEAAGTLDALEQDAAEVAAGDAPEASQENVPGESVGSAPSEPETDQVQSETEAGADAEGAVEPGVANAEAAEVPATQGGSEVRRAIDTVLGFVQQTDVSRLGVLGLLIVIYTVIHLLGAIERSFNDIWGVSKSRSLPRKLADYLSTIVLVPLLLVTGTGVMSLVRSGWLSEYTGNGGNDFLAQLSSLVVIWLGFGFAYILMPNTRTRLSSALVGGIVGGTMWQLFQFAHTKLQVGVANYNAIYSTFAALPIFLFWVHSSWMTVLIGAEAAAAHQNQARHGQLVRSRNFDLVLKETIALRLMVRVTRAFFGGSPPLRMDDLADDLGCPDRTLEEVSRMLTRASLVATVELDADDTALVLAADPDAIRMQHVIDALKGDALDDEQLRTMQAFQGEDESLGEAFSRFRRVRHSAPENSTLRELANAAAPGESGPSEVA